MAARIRRAAIALFRDRGYHGTPVREIAEAVRIETASLYYHYASKQAILFEIIDGIMDDMLRGFEEANATAGTPTQRLEAIVRVHVLFHIARQDEAFISHSDLRGLTPQNRRKIVGKRDRYETMLRALLEQGKAAGEFQIADVRITAIGILMMCSGVSDWFAGRGRLTPARVADSYAAMVTKLVSRSDAAPARAKSRRR